MGNGKSCLPCVAKPLDDKIPIKKNEPNDTLPSSQESQQHDTMLTLQTQDSPIHKANELVRPLASESSRNTIFMRSYLDEIEQNQKSVVGASLRDIAAPQLSPRITTAPRIFRDDSFFNSNEPSQ